jgi:hypothetical protein
MCDNNCKETIDTLRVDCATLASALIESHDDDCGWCSKFNAYKGCTDKEQQLNDHCCDCKNCTTARKYVEEAHE